MHRHELKHHLLLLNGLEFLITCIGSCVTKRTICSSRQAIGTPKPTILVSLKSPAFNQTFKKRTRKRFVTLEEF